MQIINIQGSTTDREMLCNEILSREDYEFKIKTMGIETIGANYQQNPIDIKVRLYGDFKTYETVPEFEAIKSYTDTAYAGADYLCSIVFGVYKKQAYVLDVLYTKENMSVIAR